MKTYTILLIYFGLTLKVCAWGFFGHKKINETAVYTLPKPLFAFYKLHVQYLKDHAVDADKRRYLIAEEACKHFLDGDFYEHCTPIDTIPKFYKDACAKYGEDTVKAHGIVPWHIQSMMYSLTEAFKAKDIQKILKLSADLGHYVGDCHVPLHATSNYNGQKTNQTGIHALWESRLPELFNGEYDLFTGTATYCEHPVTATWTAYEQSFGLVDSVLTTEKKVSAQFDETQKYAFEKKGNQTVKVYSKAYSEAYHKALGNMVEERLRASILLLGQIWYTCWVNAGQPDLEGMVLETPAPAPEDSIEEEPEKKMLGREE
ncbi:MAG: zinc dependent phospholipase C family protein [Bacteroidota bacterium]